MFDKAKEACGVYGIYTKKEEDELAPIVGVGLMALQHRGEESCGIAINRRRSNNSYKGFRISIKGISKACFGQASKREDGNRT